MTQRFWLVLVLIITVGFIFEGAGLTLIRRTIRDLNTQAEARNLETARNLRLVIEKHVDLLLSIAPLGARAGGLNRPLLRQAIESSLEHHPAFFALNLIDKNGVITDVYPADRNQSALGQNLFERTNVNLVLEESLRTLRPTMSGRIVTYQGVEGFTLYIPILHEGALQGWLNGVIDLEDWMRQSYSRTPSAPGRLRLQWSHPVPSEWEIGDRNLPLGPAKTFKVLNQELSLSIDRATSPPSGWLMIGSLGLFSLFLFSVGLLSWLLQQGTSRERDLVHQLRIKNALLSSLSRGMISPLATLREAIERAPAVMAVPEPLWQQLRTSTERLNHLQESVRMLQAIDAGNESLRLVPTSLEESINAAIDMIKDCSDFKNVRVRNEVPSDLAVRADPAILINHLLSTTLTAAIRRSPPGGEIRLRSKAVPNQPAAVDLCISDQGSPLTDNEFHLLKNPELPLPRAFHDASMSTELDHLQRKIFMELHGGGIDVESHSGSSDGAVGGTEVRLRFLREDKHSAGSPPGLP